MPQFDPRKIALLGVPSAAGARDAGQEETPALLREVGLVPRLREAGLEVADFGDLPVVPSQPDRGETNARNLDAVVQMAKDVANAVERAAESGARLLVLGGDCTITIGVVAGLVRRHPGLAMMYLDGDLDMNTPGTTSSGIFDGMGLAHMLGHGAAALSRIGPRFPLLAPEDVTLFGYSVEAGQIDDAELKLADRLGLAHYPRARIAQDIAASAAEALHALEAKADAILVHFDIDVIDFAELPATKLPHSPGLSLATTQDALDIFMRSPKAAALVVSEFNAECEGNPAIAERLAGMLATALG